MGKYCLFEIFYNPSQYVHAWLLMGMLESNIKLTILIRILAYLVSTILGNHIAIVLPATQVPK